MALKEKVPLLLFLGAITAVYLLEILFLVIFYFNRSKCKGPEGNLNILLCKSALATHFLAIVGIICFAYGYFIEPYWIEVRKIQIPTDKFSSASIRLVHISDMHCDKKIRNEQKAVEIINALDADVIVFTGDSINTQDALELFKDTLSSLHAKVGKFAVRGNFDSYIWRGVDVFGQTGFEMLGSESVLLHKDGEDFYISGIGADRTSGFADLLSNVPVDNYSIFLHHYPDLIEDLGGLNVDLYLAGHTHGGQVALPIYGALITLAKYGKKYEAGMYIVDETTLYINRGLGLERSPAPKVRFFARPEITVFDIGPIMNNND